MTAEGPRRRLRAIARSIVAQPVDLAFVGLVIVGCAFILWLGRSSTFKLDDWEFATERPPYALDYLLIPHNEHWSVFLKLPFQLLFGLFGLRSYLPYLAVLLAAHGAATLAVYAAVSAAGGRILAFATGSVLLLLGTAHESLFWFSSLGYELSLVTGAAAIWLLIVRPPTRRVGVAVFGLLLASVMSSGCGLAFIGGLGIAVLLDPARRPAWWAPVGAGLVYVVWYLIWGRSSVATITLEAIIGLPGFVFVGATNGFAAMTGLGRAVAGVAVAALFGSVWLALATGRRPPFAVIAGTAGLVAFLGVAALVRVELGALGSEAAAAPRYIAITAPLLAISLAAVLGRPIDRSAATLRALAVAPLLLIALVSNVAALVNTGPRYAADATAIRATLAVVDRDRDAQAIRSSTRLLMPASTLIALVDAYGSPRRDEIRPTVVLPVTAEDRDRALFEVVRDGLIVAPDYVGGEQPAATSAPSGLGAFEMDVQKVGGCLRVQPLGPAGLVWLTVRSEDRLRISTDGWGDIGVLLARDAPFDTAESVHQTVIAHEPYIVTLPDMGPGSTWRVAIKLGGGIRSASICTRSAAAP